MTQTSFFAVCFVPSVTAVENAKGESMIVTIQIMYRSAHSSANLIKFHAIKSIKKNNNK